MSDPDPLAAELSTEAAFPVSPGNPCPFLRGLVADGWLPGHIAALSTIADTVVAASDGAPSEAPLPGLLVYLVAMVGNGLGPARLVRSVRDGAQLDALRGGPLDKRGAGSGILDAAANINADELARLDMFAVDKVDASGRTERGLGAPQLVVMMDANFARAAGRRRPIDRTLMNGEWPVLLRVMGKDAADGRYLSLVELGDLFVDRRLPARIEARLKRKRPPRGAAFTSGSD